MKCLQLQGFAGGGVECEHDVGFPILASRSSKGVSPFKQNCDEVVKVGQALYLSLVLLHNVKKILHAGHPTDFARNFRA